MNEEREGKPPRLYLCTAEGEVLNFYACSVREIEAELDSQDDWRADVMGDA